MEQIMFLNQVEINDWLIPVNNAGFTQEYREILEVVFTSLYWKNYSRVFRETYSIKNDDGSYRFQPVVESYLKSNKKKIEYMIETVKDDFLFTSQESTQSDNNTNYNVDYYGAEGERAKNTNTMTYSNKNIDNKNKLWDFSSIEENYLWKTLMNILFDTFYVPEGITW